MIELILLPFEGYKTIQYSHTVLRLCGFALPDFNSKLYKSLNKLTEKAKKSKQFVPPHFSSYVCREIDKRTGYDEAHYGDMTNIVYVSVRDLLELEDLHNEYYKDNDPKDIKKEKALATMSYIKALPKNRKVALYWN